MSFVIFNPENGLYYRHLFGMPYSWVEEPEHALKFARLQRAKNYLQNNFRHLVRNVSPENMSIIDLNKPLPVPVCVASEAHAQAMIEALPQRIEELGQAADMVPVLTNYFAARQKTADLETIDLLHKIEFTELDVVSGFLIYRQLQEVRLRRRRAKDSLELLSLFQESGILEGLGKLRDTIREYQKRIDNRSYLPRVLDELFDESPKTPEQVQQVLPAGNTGPAGAAGETEEPPQAPKTAEQSAEKAPQTPKAAGKLPHSEPWEIAAQPEELEEAFPGQPARGHSRSTANTRAWSRLEPDRRRSVSHRPAERPKRTLHRRQ